MAIARRVGGFSPAQADDLRKAISKKNKELMATLKEPLMAGPRREAACHRRVANKLWASFEATGDYSFNKSHAACYAHDQLPHRLAQGQLPGRVHGGADLAAS